MLHLSEELQISDSLIPKGTVVEVPLWLARTFMSSGVALLMAPRQFGTRVRADLAADAEAVSLKDLCPYWYRFGLKVSGLLPAENIARLGKAALSGRLGYLSKGVFSSADRSSCDPHKTMFGGSGQNGSVLDFTEMNILTETVTAKKDCDQWLARNHTKLKSSDLFIAMRY